MGDAETTVSQLKAWVLAFSKDRDWEQFHHPKDLGIALASEVGELLDHFRFKSDERIAADLGRPEVFQAIAHEMADCLWALLRLADVCQVDLSSSLVEKLALARLKYPVDQSRGRSEKYTAYRPIEPEASGDG